MIVPGVSGPRGGGNIQIPRAVMEILLDCNRTRETVRNVLAKNNKEIYKQDLAAYKKKLIEAKELVVAKRKKLESLRLNIVSVRNNPKVTNEIAKLAKLEEQIEEELKKIRSGAPAGLAPDILGSSEPEMGGSDFAVF